MALAVVIRASESVDILSVDWANVVVVIPNISDALSFRNILATALSPVFIGLRDSCPRVRRPSQSPSGTSRSSSCRPFRHSSSGHSASEAWSRCSPFSRRSIGCPAFGPPPISRIAYSGHTRLKFLDTTTSLEAAFSNLLVLRFVQKRPDFFVANGHFFVLPSRDNSSNPKESEQAAP